MVYQSSTNLYQISKYIVDVNGGPYTTIQSALDAANAAAQPATVYVRSGTYTENLTLYSNINICGEGARSSSSVQATRIIGGHTFPATGYVILEKIFFNESTSYIFITQPIPVASSFKSIIKDCIFEKTSGTVFSYQNTASHISIYLENVEDVSTGNVGIQNIYVDFTSPSMVLNNCVIGNGTKTSKFANSDNALKAINTTFNSPVEVMFNSANFYECKFYGNSGTAAVIDTGSTSSFYNCIFESAAVANINMSTDVRIYHSSLNCGVATAIIGTGILFIDNATFVSNNGIAGALTTAYGSSTQIDSLKFTTDVAAANLEITGTIISGAGSDADVGITLTPKGAGDLTLDGLKWPQADGTADYILKTDGAAQLSWIENKVGDVVGPASSTDNAIARYDLATGKLLQDSSVLIDDTNNITGVVALTATTVNATTFDTNVAAAGVTLTGTTLSVDGSDSNIDLSLTSKGTGTTKVTGGLSLVPTGTQTIVAGTGITSAMFAGIIRIDGTGGVTVTATPSIAAGADGQIIIIQGTHDTNTVTLQDETSLGSSGLKLDGAANFTLGKGDILQLVYDSGDGKWLEISRSNN